MLRITHYALVSFSGLTDFGWHRQDCQLMVTWDTPENVQKVHRSINFLIQGSKCKTGCNSKRCKCTKTGLQCGPSCQCANCKNIKSYSPAKETECELYEEIRQQMRDDRNEDGLEDEGETSVAMEKQIQTQIC